MKTINKYIKKKIKANILNEFREFKKGMYVKNISEDTYYKVEIIGDKSIILKFITCESEDYDDGDYNEFYIVNEGYFEEIDELDENPDDEDDEDYMYTDMFTKVSKDDVRLSML